jgi:hypothetical protein
VLSVWAAVPVRECPPPWVYSEEHYLLVVPLQRIPWASHLHPVDVSLPPKVSVRVPEWLSSGLSHCHQSQWAEFHVVSNSNPYSCQVRLKLVSLTHRSATMFASHVAVGPICRLDAITRDL